MTGASGAAAVANSPLPKWQLALVVGAPVALGLGYMYYKNSSKPSSKSDREKFKTKSKKNGISIEKQISADEPVDSKGPLSSEPKTPLQKAHKFKQEGNSHFKAGQFDEAIAQYNNGIEVCPEENVEELAVFYQNRAACYEQLKAYNAVTADCTKAIELQPKYAKAFLRRARALEHNNDLESALEDVTTACVLENFVNQSAILMSDRVLKKLGRQHAEEYMATKDHIMPSKCFIKKYISTFSCDPVFNMVKNPDTNDLAPGFLNILQALREERYDDIIPLCMEELNKSDSEELPHRMELLLLKATFLHLLGKHDEAIKDFEFIISNSNVPDAIKINAFIKKAALFMQLEQPEKCFGEFDEACKIDANCEDIYHHRGQIQLLLGEFEKAKEDCQKAVDLNPLFSVAVVQKCYADYRYGLMTRDAALLDRTIKDFDHCIEKFPDYSECYTVYAQILLDAGEYETADAMFAKAIEKDSTPATIYVHRGLMQLFWNSNIEKAIKYFGEALALDDKCELVYEALGTIEVQRGNLKMAIQHFDKALQLSRTITELAHNFSLMDAAKAQLNVKERLGSAALWNVQNIQ